jgi:hypothetical protein
VKWRLMTGWFDTERTVLAKGYDPGDEELGSLSRLRRYLVRRWLVDLPVMPPTEDMSQSDIDLALAANAALQSKSNSHFSTVAEGIGMATPIALAEGDPTAASRLRKRVPLGRWRSASPKRSEEGPESRAGSSEGRPGSGVMVEEKSEDERSGDEAAGGRMEERRKGFQERLNVPLYPGGAGIVAGGL